jgi:signal transduction histidine kinase
LDKLGEAFALNAGSIGINYVSGTGLGLAICKGIAAAHGGAIGVASEPGQGTEITVRLRCDLDGPVHTKARVELVGQT